MGGIKGPTVGGTHEKVIGPPVLNFGGICPSNMFCPRADKLKEAPGSFTWKIEKKTFEEAFMFRLLQYEAFHKFDRIWVKLV